MKIWHSYSLSAWKNLINLQSCQPSYVLSLFLIITNTCEVVSLRKFWTINVHGIKKSSHYLTALNSLINLCDLVKTYDTTLSTLINIHALFITEQVMLRPHVPGYTRVYGHLKRGQPSINSITSAMLETKSDHEQITFSGWRKWLLL